MYCKLWEIYETVKKIYNESENTREMQFTSEQILDATNSLRVKVQIYL